ncbi:DUF3455 domain-containing protein [Rhizobium sp. P32RR-XVIII]|uniref:DUF3455 domain-containing protein n=1 Tax=Rhizobium sp. P32RR-XVIII TaxID=2726738 RepID=UPI003917D75D
MLTIKKLAVLGAAFLFPLPALSLAGARVPDAIAAAGDTPVAMLHAEGAQIYHCEADPKGKLAWQFREPIATLLMNGKTIGRHYAGPSWELADGSRIVGRVVASAPGTTPRDVPWLKLEATSQPVTGRLAGATVIQRINTKGGVAGGHCGPNGALSSVPYSADYVFLKKHG